MSRMERNEQAMGLRSALPVDAPDYLAAGKPGAGWLPQGNRRQLARVGAP